MHRRSTAELLFIPLLLAQTAARDEYTEPGHPTHSNKGPDLLGADNIYWKGSDLILALPTCISVSQNTLDFGCPHARETKRRSSQSLTGQDLLLYEFP
ncbi:hypothetical protein Tco_0686556 [Tanacetum coccineum]